MTNPINVTWTGDSFEPANRFWATKCDERFVVGQAYSLDEVHARSTATHAHYFAALHELWQSLPERMSEKFPTEEHLRKYALIRAGYRTETQHVCKTPAEAERLAAAIRPYDTYQIVTLNDLVVTVYNAISQDMRSMDKQTFQKSKEAVLDFCSDLVGIDPVETRRLAGIPVSPSEAVTPLEDASVVDGTPPAEASPLPSAPTDFSPSSVGASIPAEPDMFGKFNFVDGEFQHLKDFARKALDDASGSNDTPAKDAAISKLVMNYAEVIDSDEGKSAMKAMSSPFAAVIDGKRTREQASNYIARDILGCDPIELEGRRNG